MFFSKIFGVKRYFSKCLDIALEEKDMEQFVVGSAKIEKLEKVKVPIDRYKKF